MAEMTVISGCGWVPHGLFLYHGATARDTFPPNYLDWRGHGREGMGVG
jgi:hypothetical protein